MFEQQFEYIFKISCNQLAKAQQTGPSFNLNITESVEIKHFVIILNFFTESQLLESAEEFKGKLNDFISADSVFNILMGQARRYKQMNTAMKQLYQRMIQVFNQSTQEVVKAIIDLRNYAFVLGQGNFSTELDALVQTANKVWQKMIADLNKEQAKLVEFVFYLR